MELLVHYQAVLTKVQIHGVWCSEPISPFQNACFCFEILEDAEIVAAALKVTLGSMAAQYNQDFIAWAEAETEMLTPNES